MIVSHVYRFVLVTPPKTASTSLHAFLSQPPFRRRPWEPAIGDQHSAAIPDNCTDYLTVTCWRHPLDREVSLWAHSQSEASRATDHTEPMTFAEFVHDFQPTAKPFYSWSQARWLGSIRIDAVLRFGHLGRDLMTLAPVVSALREGHGLQPLRHLNTTHHASALDLYTGELRKIVHDRFADDLETACQTRSPWLP